MKKLLIVMLAIASVAAVAFGQQVLSRNAVGYQQITLTKGVFSMVRHDFEDLDTPLAISNVFASLPTSSKVYLWKTDQSGYNTITKAALGGWGAGGTNILYRGSGVWVLVPASAVSNEYQVFLMGEVPDRFTAPSSTVGVAAGFTLSGYSYPVVQSWTNLSIAKQAPVGSKLYIWTGAGYDTYTRAALGGWGAAGNALLINPGQGFWLKWANATNWSELKPYTWP
ncbi:MAG: hypothetical protein KA248_05525 [Kiritimatiellae bacterium]|nr:hypothetical protein [Kiritimatiellia bacterium]